MGVKCFYRDISGDAGSGGGRDEGRRFPEYGASPLEGDTEMVIFECWVSAEVNLDLKLYEK